MISSKRIQPTYTHHIINIASQHTHKLNIDNPEDAMMENKTESSEHEKKIANTLLLHDLKYVTGNSPAKSTGTRSKLLNKMTQSSPTKTRGIFQTKRFITQKPLNEMTTGQYIHKINVDLKQNKQTIQQAIRNEWRGPIFETLNRITIVGGNGPVRKYFGNGHLKSEILYKNGEREGKARLYYENGRVRAESFYKDGKLVGKVKEYYENGFLKREGATTEAVEQLR